MCSDSTFNIDLKCLNWRSRCHDISQLNSIPVNFHLRTVLPNCSLGVLKSEGVCLSFWKIDSLSQSNIPWHIKLGDNVVCWPIRIVDSALSKFDSSVPSWNIRKECVLLSEAGFFETSINHILGSLQLHRNFHLFVKETKHNLLQCFLIEFFQGIIIRWRDCSVTLIEKFW